MISVFRILPLVFLIARTISADCRLKSLKIAGNEIPRRLKSLLLIILGSIGLFGAFIAAAELITKLRNNVQVSYFTNAEICIR